MKALTQFTLGAQLSQSYDWFACYWQRNGSDQQMEALLVSDNSDLLGIVPRVVRTETRQIGRVHPTNVQQCAG